MRLESDRNVNQKVFKFLRGSIHINKSEKVRRDIILLDCLEVSCCDSIKLTVNEPEKAREYSRCNANPKYKYSWKTKRWCKYR